MSYIRPPGQGMTTTGPEVEETYRNGEAISFSNVWSHEGTEAEIDAQRVTDRLNGASRITKRPAGNGLWQLIVAYPFDTQTGGETEEPQDLHEIEVQVEQIPVWGSERLRDHMSDSNIAIVKKYVELYLSGGALDGVSGNPTKADYITAMKAETTDDTDAENLFNRVASGTESALEYREVYRRTITAASWLQVQASYDGVGKIWTTDEVVGFEGVPNGEWFGLRNGMQWLKAPPSVQAAAGGKTQIQYYYTEFKQATALLYEAYGSATLLDA